MALPTLLGRYIAGLTSWQVGEFKEAPTFEVVFQLRQFFDPQSGEWVQTIGDLEITKRFFLKKNDGTWSDHALKSIESSLGWDGASLASLANSDWSQVEVQVTVEREPDKNDPNKSYVGVKFMNPRDYEGRQLSSDPALVQSLDAKYGSELRVRKSASGRPSNGSARPAAKRTTPAQAIMAPKTAQEAKVVAWNEFKSKTTELSEENRKASFVETVTQYANGKDPKALTINDWGVIANQIAEFGPYIQPVGVVGDGETISDEDIPF